MRIQYKENPIKIVYIWISEEEGQNKDLLDSLKSQFVDWKEKSYLPVVIESGDQALETGMYHLMKHHYEKIAKRQLSNE